MYIFPRPAILVLTNKQLPVLLQILDRMKEISPPVPGRVATNKITICLHSLKSILNYCKNIITDTKSINE